MAPETIRCFVAIELPEEVKSEMEGVQARLRKAAANCVRWVGPGGIHLTLKFIGWAPQERVPEMVRAIEEAVHGFTPFKLEMGGLGVFPDVRRPRVLWVGLRGQVDTLAALQQNIDVSFGVLGFAAEERAFTAHLTLGRVRDSTAPDEKRALGELVSRTPFDSGLAFAVSAVHLMRSELKPAGAVYSSLAAVPLKG